MPQAGMVTANEPVFLYYSRLFWSPHIFTATGLDSDRDFSFLVFRIYLNDALPACFLFRLGQCCVLRCQRLTVFSTLYGWRYLKIAFVRVFITQT